MFHETKFLDFRSCQMGPCSVVWAHKTLTTSPIDTDKHALLGGGGGCKGAVHIPPHHWNLNISVTMRNQK